MPLGVAGCCLAEVPGLIVVNSSRRNRPATFDSPTWDRPATTCSRSWHAPDYSAGRGTPGPIRWALGSTGIRRHRFRLSLTAEIPTERGFWRGCRRLRVAPDGVATGSRT